MVSSEWRINPYSLFATHYSRLRDRSAAHDLQQVRPHRFDMLRQKPAGLVDLLRPA
jgi:hypothetical protein